MLRIVTALCILAAGAATAAPVGKTLQQKEAHSYGLELPAPNGYCALSQSHRADREMLDATAQLNAGHNRVLAIFADCGQLDAMRAKGVILSNYAMYLMPLSAGEAPLPMPRADLLEELARALTQNDPFARARDTVRDRIADADMAIELQDMVGLGLLHRDDTAVFTGVLTRTAIEGGAVDVSAVVSAMTLVSGRIVSLNLAAPYEGQQTVDRLLDQQRGNVRHMIESN